MASRDQRVLPTPTREYEPAGSFEPPRMRQRPPGQSQVQLRAVKNKSDGDGWRIPDGQVVCQHLSFQCVFIILMLTSLLLCFVINQAVETGCISGVMSGGIFLRLYSCSDHQILQRDLGKRL